MDNRIDISNELKTLSPLLAGIGNVNVFTVPAGYFDTLGETVLMSVKEETDGGLLGLITGQPSMQVPQGYFESLADDILNKIKATAIDTTEVNELSPTLYSIQQKNVYAVPQGYFESLADSILNKIKATSIDTAEVNDLSPMLTSIKHKNVFIVPQGYFELLANSILNKVTGQDNAAKELRELSPMLYSIQNENVFTVPQGYFNSLSHNILDKVKPQAAKVVMMKRPTTTTILKYAVAAVFTGVMALGVYKFTNNNANIGKNSDDPTVAIGKQIAKENKFDEELSKVSDNDIIKYLQVNGSDADVAIAANIVDENELPTQEDYLTDDKALDKYLDNIDVNDLKN